jgi:light-regulated signal transduction histidine kinase (bacteriophytochrome)
LEEDYAAKLDDGALRILNLIKGNSHKMSTLIDDLLNFSKLGKKEISKSIINMDELVKEVVNGLKNTANNTNFKISHLPFAFADYALLRQVLINLLSNAIKYSGKKEKIEIEISCTTEKDKTVYFVKDNGAGFDMQYAAKLFGVFQRLHGTEYEGTGVGLAIVHRIISKHGGKVWAESEPGTGACFYFSLPEAPSAENQPSGNNGTISNAHIVH